MRDGQVTRAHPETQKLLSELKRWLENDEPMLDIIEMCQDWREAGCPDAPVDDESAV